MADTLVERQASLSVMEMQTAATLKGQRTPVRTAQIPSHGCANAATETQGHAHLAGGM